MSPQRIGGRRRATKIVGAGLLAVASAGLLALAFAGDRLAPLALPALAPLSWAARRSGPASACALGIVCALACGVACAPWIPAALEELGASRTAAIGGLVAAAVWAGSPVFAALAFTSWATRRGSTGTRVLALAAVVFVVEWTLSVRAWGVPWLLLGYTQMGWTGVAQLAAVGGVPGVSALVVAVGASLEDALSGGPRAPRLAAALLVAWATLAAWGLPWAEALRPASGAGATTTDLLLLQPDLPRGDRWRDALQPAVLARVDAFAGRALAREAAGVDALVLPENLLTSPLDAGLRADLAAWVDELGVPVLLGLVLPAEGPDPALYRSSAAWLVPGRGLGARVDKERAIPVVESGRVLPGPDGVSSLLGTAATLRRVEEGPAAGPLDGPHALAPLLCYELLFPRIAARRRAAGSLALVNLADLGWLPGPAADRHFARVARARAIEQRVAVVRVVQGGRSAVYDAFGRTRAVMPAGAWTARRVTLSPSPRPGAIERVAPLALPVAAFALVGALPVPRRARAASSAGAAG